MADLIQATLTDLQFTDTPPATKTWQPIPHLLARTRLLEALHNNVAPIVEEKIEITEDGLTAIGRFTLQHSPDQEWCPEIVWWNDHTKKRGLTYAAGERVFVCTNGCLFAETKLSTKRTAGVMSRIAPLAAQFASGLMGALRTNEDRRQIYANTHYDLDAMRALVVRLSEAGVFSSSKILQVVNEVEKPSFEYGHHNLSVLGIQSAVTHILKGYSTEGQYTRSLRLTELLDQRVQLNEIIA